MKKIKEMLDRYLSSRRKKEINYSDISIGDIEEELHREIYRHSFSKLFKNTLSVLIIIVAIATLFATLFMPVLEITNSSMKPLLNDNEIALSIKTSKLKTGDIIAFYHGNKILVKRVIAVSGDWVNIDSNGVVYVNGNELKETYVSELIRGDTGITYPLQVSDNSVFVLSDERDITMDSRNEDISFIKNEDVIGKLCLRIWPFRKIGVI